MATNFARGRCPSDCRLLAAPDSLLFLGEDKAHPVADKVVQAVFWPIAVCVYLSGSRRAYRTSRETPVRGDARSDFCGLDWDWPLLDLLFQPRLFHSVASAKAAAFAKNDIPSVLLGPSARETL